MIYYVQKYKIDWSIFMSFTDELYELRHRLRTDSNVLVTLNGIAGKYTADYTIQDSTEEKNYKMPARTLAATATAATLAQGAKLVAGTIAVEGVETLELAYKTATEFIAANTIIPATSLIGGIATTAGATLALGMITAGAIDFITRITNAPAGTFFKIESFTDFLGKVIGCITSATAIPSVSLLIAHSILWIGSVLNAIAHLLSEADSRNEAWKEVSKNSRAVCFYLAAIVLMPLTNIIDLVGALMYKGYKAVGGCVCSGGETKDNTAPEAPVDDQGIPMPPPLVTAPSQPAVRQS